MNAARARKEITLSGPPQSTAAVIPLEPVERIVPVMVTLADGVVSCKARIRPFGKGTSEIRLRLPRDTAPGTYRAEAALGGALHGITIEVEPVTHVRVQPTRSSLSAKPQSRVEFAIEIMNGGNVPFDVPEVTRFDLDAAEGQDRALGRTLRVALEPGERRVDRFFEELRADHGGEARVTVRAGAGRLAPGESRALSCVLEVPAAVQPGRFYLGGWPLGNTAHLIALEVTNGTLTRQGRPSQ